MGIKIYVDDERRKPDEFDLVVRSNMQLHDVMHTIAMAGGTVDTVSFDHDNMHGEDFFAGLTAFRFYNYWPENLVFHTANPIAHAQMVAWANDNAPDTTWVDPRFFWPRELG